MHEEEISVNPVEQSTVEPKPLGPNTKKSYRKLLVGGSIVAAAIVAGSIFGIKLASETPKNTALDKNPTKSSQTPSATPSEVAAHAPNISELIAAQEIKTGQTPEALGNNIITMVNSLTMSGIDTFAGDWDAEVAKTGDASDASRTTYANKYAKKQFTEIYGPAVFGIKEGDVIDPALQKGIDGLIVINSDNLQLNWLTAQETNPFISKRVIDTPVQLNSRDNQQVTISINYTETNNASQNRAGAAYSNLGTPNPNGSKDTLRVTLINNGTIEKITAMDFHYRT